MGSVVGHPKKPIEGCGPISEFAQQLRDLRAAAGYGRSYVAMAKRATDAGHKTSPASLSTADGGKKLPTWPVVEAYLAGCSVADLERVADWQRRWEAVDAMPVGELMT